MTNRGVSLEKEKALQEAMIRLGIREADIVENFVRSGGPGGQNVNKVSTCVHLKHLPTGLEVKCQQERSQALNRYRGRQLLVRKIETLILGKLSEEQKRIAKIRRQKRRRTRRTRLKLLELKRQRSHQKKMRAPVRDIDL
jgi:protein subunit release factor B